LSFFPAGDSDDPVKIHLLHFLNIAAHRIPEEIGLLKNLSAVFGLTFFPDFYPAVFRTRREEQTASLIFAPKRKQNLALVRRDLNLGYPEAKELIF
jgi:hypothetical protein